MPIFLLALLGGLGQIAGNMVGRVLLALGIGYVTYQGLSILLTGLQNQGGFVHLVLLGMFAMLHQGR